MEVFRASPAPGRPDDRRRPGQPEDGPGAAPDLRPDGRARSGCSRWASAPASGGMFNNYAIVQGVDHVVPVDMYLPGCPPRPEMLIDAILKLHEQIQAHQARRATGAPRSPSSRPAALTAPADRRDEGPAAMSDGDEPGRRDADRPTRPSTSPLEPVDVDLDQVADGRRRPARHVRRHGLRRHLRLRRPGPPDRRCPAPTQRALRRLVRRGRRRARAGLADAGVPARRRSRRSSSTAARSPSTSRREHLLAVARSAARRRRRCASSSALGVSGVHYPDETGRELHAVYHLLSMTHNRRIRRRGHLPRRRPAHPVASSRSTRPTTGTSARPTTSSASSSTATRR